MTTLVLLELNELNFELIKKYTEQGYLPHFKKLISRHGISETESELEYDHLEPWIQWVTAHTGMPFNEHKIFRLGDCVNQEHDQIWERLEREKGLKVGAVSPFNAVNRIPDGAFFIPDPWTSTGVTGSRLDRALSGAVSQAVNDNANSKVTVRSLLTLLVGALFYARIRNWSRYLKLVWSSLAKPWRRAMFLDLFLADIFINKVRRSGLDFASLFLNAGAHIQHHYLFSSDVYDGRQSNPSWYVKPGEDPVRDVYQLYDAILGDIIRVVPDSRIMLATALHQDPYPVTKFYYRLKNHGAFLDKMGIKFASVSPRMSRDFLISFDSPDQAEHCEEVLSCLKSVDGTPIFYIDNRGKELFVTLTYPKEIGPGFQLFKDGNPVGEFYNDVSFVAIKNGKHNGIGYFLDTGTNAEDGPKRFSLQQLPDKIAACFAQTFPRIQ